MNQTDFHKNVAKENIILYLKDQIIVNINHICIYEIIKKFLFYMGSKKVTCMNQIDF